MSTPIYQQGTLKLNLKTDRSAFDGIERDVSNKLHCIDGIDECLDARFQQRILKVTTAIKTLISHCGSSSPRPTSKRPLIVFEPPILHFDIASLHDTNSDVEHCLRVGFARFATEQGFDPTWLGQHIVQRLVSKSCGHFLYAADLIRRVGDMGDDAQTQLYIILTLMPPHTMSPLAELSAAYWKS